MESLEDKITKLPPDLKKEVEDFIDFLLYRQDSKKGKKLSFEWAGCLSKYRDKYTALDLEKQGLNWR